MGDSRSNGATLKMGRLWTLNTGTVSKEENETKNNHEFKFILQNDALNLHHNSYLTLAWDMRNICFQQDSCMCEYTEIH